MTKLLYLAVLAALVLAAAVPALAQQSGVNPVKDPGDNYHQGRVVGDDTPDCARAADVLSSGLCVPPGNVRVGEASFRPVDSGANLNCAAAAIEVNGECVPADKHLASPVADQYGATPTATSLPSVSASALPPTGGFVKAPEGWTTVLAILGGLMIASGGYLAYRTIRA